MRLGRSEWSPPEIPRRWFRDWWHRPLLDRFDVMAQRLDDDVEQLFEFEQRLRDLRIGMLLHEIRDRDRADMEFIKQCTAELVPIMEELFDRLPSKTDGESS